MKTFPAGLLCLAILIASVLCAEAQAQLPNIPTISAKTANIGRNENKYQDRSGATVRETIQSQGANADIFFLKAPTSDYQVQCFFIASDETTKEQFIYDAQSITAHEQRRSFNFQAPPLMGTVRRSLSLPVSGMTRSGEQVDGSIYFNSSASGAKIYGWLIRVISAGKVVRIETNQYPLKRTAENNPAYFDAAFKQP